MAAWASRSRARVTPKLALAASVPATDWNVRSTGAPASIRPSVVVTWARTHVWVGMSYSVRRSSSRRSRASTAAGLSVAGLTPMTASPHPYSRPSRTPAAMPAGSSVGWFGWSRMASRPGRPSVLRKAVVTRHLLAIRIRSCARPQLGDGGDHLRRQPGRDGRQGGGVGLVRQQPLAEGADGQVGQGGERRRVVRVDDQPGDLVGLVRDDLLLEEAGERDVGQHELRGDPLAGIGGGDAGQPVARPRRGGFGQQVAEVGEGEAGAAVGGGVGRHRPGRCVRAARIVPRRRRGGHGRVRP